MNYNVILLWVIVQTQELSREFFKSLNILDVIKSSKHERSSQKSHCMQREDGRATYEEYKYLKLTF